MTRVFNIGKRRKYGNIKTEYDGFQYDSRAEAQWARFLDIARSAQDTEQRVVDIQRQVKYDLVVNEIPVCKYIADFVVTFADGHEEIQDVKGFETKEYKIKKKLFSAVFGKEIKEIKV